MSQEIKRIMLANVYDGLYHGHWVGLAPYILRAYAEQFEISKHFEFSICQFDHNDSVDDIVRAINKLTPDAIGLSLYVYNARKTLNVIKRLKCCVILGGPHVTGVEIELLDKNPQIDIVVTGEGEITFKKLLDHFAGLIKINDIPGITTRDFQTTPSTELVDLDTIPSVYKQIVTDLTRAGNICFETSRGCPFRCGYCAWSFDKKMRYYDLERVLEDLNTICSSKFVKVIQSADASLFSNKQRAKKILQHLIKLSPKQEFYFELNLEHVDDELIELMARLPNQEFSFGIQAVDQNANKEMGRVFNPEIFRKNFQKIASKLVKAQLHVDILYPLPGDTLDGFKRSIEFALSLDKVHFIKFNALILLPGSEFFRNKEKYGFKLRNEETRLVESCYTFSREDLKEAIRYANYALILHSNTKFKESVRLMAKKNGVGMLDIIEEVIDSLPFDLFDGEELPEMITAEMNEEKLLFALAPAYFNYGKLIKQFKNYSHHEYDEMLKGWRSAFLRVGNMKLGIVLRLLCRRLKMLRIKGLY